MMDCFKLTDECGRTRPGLPGETQWGPGVRHEATGVGGLCSAGVIHAYVGPLTAVLMNPIQAVFDNPLGWWFEGEGEAPLCDGMKFGFPAGTTVQQVALPELPLLARMRCVIILAQRGGRAGALWGRWAEDWLSGKDRTKAASARARVYAAEVAAEAAAWAARAPWSVVQAAVAEAAAWAVAAAVARAALYAAEAAEAAEAEARFDGLAWARDLEALLAECIEAEAALERIH